MSHVRYTDPRIYDLVRDYRWQQVQLDLLEGRRSWGKALMRGEQRQIDWMLDCLRGLGFTFRPVDFAMEIGTINPLPEVDPSLQRNVDQYGLRDLPIIILSLEHVEDCDGVPILKGVVHGSTGGIVGTEPAKYGIQETYVVGRLDVRQVCVSQSYDLDADGALQWVSKREQRVHVVSPRGHMRQTLKRARNTARKISAGIPKWESFCVEREATEAKERFAAEQAAADLELEPLRAQVEADVDAGCFDDLL